MKIGESFARMTAVAAIAASLGAAQAQTVAPAQGQNAAPAQQAAPRPPVNRITGAAPDASWEEEYAYALGVQAYVHLFPWTYNALLRWRWSQQAPQKGMSAPVIEPNTLVHQRVLTDATYRDGGRPNADALYSVAWVDLTREPMILKVPDFGNRYYSFQLVNFDADNFDYIGTRATGNRAGTYALVGPNWKGKLPDGVKAIAPAQTNWILVLLRVLVDDVADAPAAHKLQDEIIMVPLGVYEGRAASAPKFVAQPPLNRQQDPLADWKNINRALAESPMPAYEAQLAKAYAQIGIGPGVDVEKMNPAVKRGLVRAQQAGRMIVTSGPANNAGRVAVNGWGMTPPNWGRLSPDGHYLARSAKSLGGFVTHDPEENIYPATFVDDRGEALNESRRYVLRFSKGEIPQVNAFWSVTLYGPDFNFVDNSINRYAIGDRTRGLKYDADGGLTIYIQKEAPGGEKDSNWLPSGGGNFHLVLRAYLPRAAMLEGKWAPPGVRRVD